MIAKLRFVRIRLQQSSLAFIIGVL